MNFKALTKLFAVALLCGAANAQGTGYWHTFGSNIVDSKNQTVRIAGVNWYGFETGDEVAHGLWAQDYKTILNAVKTNGYNTVRLPFSNQMVETPIVPSNISYNNGSGAINGDLKGLNSLQVMDKIIAYAGQIGLRVILDNHRSEAGNSAEANGLWYTGAYPESAWLNDWTTLAKQYLNNTTVIGADLRNEPHNATSGGACWGCGSTTNDWRLAAQRGGNAVLNINPNWLVFVEGNDCFNGDCDWWGGNLEGARSFPVVLNVADRLVYSPHDYGPTEFGQSWFNGSTSSSSLNAVWTKFWAYLSLNGTAPVWVGEFGTPNNNSDLQNSAPGSQGQWFQSLVNFLHTNESISWTYWALNGEDRYGLLGSNYDSTPANSLKQQMLASIQSPLGGTVSCAGAPAAPANLKATAASSSQINLTWSTVQPSAGCSISYNVYASENSGFTPTSANRVATGLGTAAFSRSGLSASTTYYFIVTAVDSVGESNASSTASATTKASVGQTVNSPSGLKAAATSSSQITLTWTASTTGTVTYNVYRSQTSGFSPSTSNRIATNVSATSYQNGGLTASTTYFYLVTAANANGESAPSGQASATTQGNSPGSTCHVSYAVNTQWNNGFNVAITVQNTGSTAINGWTLTWTWGGNQVITQAWNSELVNGGPNVVLKNATWNNAIAPGGSASGVGFNASYSGTNPSPKAFFLNGHLCQ